MIEPQEHRERQERAREAAAARGLRALVAISRGGHDRVADALWLTGAATPQPLVPDLPGRWRAAGHVVVVLPVDGPVTAVVESGDLGHALRRVKSAAEQRLLHEAGRLGSEAMTAALAAAAPGVSEAAVAATLIAHVVEGGGAVYDVVLSSGPSSTALGPSDRPAGWTTRPSPRGTCCGSTRTAPSAGTCSTSPARSSSAAPRPPWIGPDSREVVEPGWCLAVERRAAVPGIGGAQYEDDVLIGPGGAELLTRTGV